MPCAVLVCAGEVLPGHGWLGLANRDRMDGQQTSSKRFVVLPRRVELWPRAGESGEGGQGSDGLLQETSATSSRDWQARMMPSLH